MNKPDLQSANGQASTGGRGVISGTSVGRLALPRVGFVKVDVEGPAVKVLTGTQQVLETSRPTLLLEVNERALCAQGTSAEALLDVLRLESDYEALVFSKVTGEIGRMAKSAELSADVAAAPRERISEILDKG